MPFPLPPPDIAPPPLVSPQPVEIDTLAGTPESDLLGTTVRPNGAVPPSPSPNHYPNPLRLTQADADTAVIREDPLEAISDRQEYDLLRRLFNAIGNVLIRFREAELTADVVQTDLDNQILVAEGNVVLQRGDQTLRGDRLEYNLVLDRGVVINAVGVVNARRGSQDLDFSQRVDPLDTLGLPGFAPGRPRSPQAIATADVERMRFQADRLEFDGQRWIATNLRVTNDPFTPPELEYRANNATITTTPKGDTVLLARGGRLVFDQRIALPVFVRRYVVGRPYEFLPIEPGYDEEDRGGLYFTRRFHLLNTNASRVVISPAIYLQRIISNDFSVGRSDSYGATVDISHDFSPRTRLGAYGLLTTLDASNWGDTSRALLQLDQDLGKNHWLSLRSIYRERIFNGSLREQELRSSFGGTLTSPVYPLGNTGATIDYLVGGQYVTANSDLITLPPRPSLGRIQGVVNFNWGMSIWEGDTLPPTRSEGLRYSPEPIQPFVQFYTGAAGIANLYTNGSTQPAIRSGLGFRGQVGHFSRNWFDYTSFDLGYSYTFNNQSSPFLFDRIVDFSVVNVGLMQQVYGPIRVGTQMQINVETGAIFNTDVFLDYHRRTYGLGVRYNLDRQIAAVMFRLSGFNWRGTPDPFSSPVLGTSEDGVIVPGTR
ncbi:DUF3769 domain-containing protein [Candidatus Synechococcus calcipolaris G9]|uniref:DUF3769 domain-containing protein n=1 Tax=Candidatus Synechococcus calcipolaris G9 TaxID=1497997 RepID=A0ABT6EVT0_9SYNE|nr:DUF3769 domain-containing protein [Candidatus Synechococcus calcipolaris]MDG2989863.1 DUF3769 domain-containing protein [Candidatus Synechococcus calcipolaris G9]